MKCFQALPAVLLFGLAWTMTVPSPVTTPLPDLVLARQASPAPLTAGTEESMPSATFVVHLRVGGGSFLTGDYDPNDLEELMAKPCNSAGCDGGTPQLFNFNATQSDGLAQYATGSLLMTGAIDNDTTIEQALLAAINTTLRKTGNCTQVKTEFGSPYNQKRYMPPGIGDTHMELTQCHFANYIQAVLYNTTNPSKLMPMADMSMQGTSDDMGPMGCQQMLGGINEALRSTKLPSLYRGTIVAHAICGLSKAEDWLS